VIINTENLSEGNLLWHSNPKSRVDLNTMSHDGIRAGVVFGDGSCDQGFGQRKTDSYVVLYGNKDFELLKYFGGYSVGEVYLHSGEDTDFMKNNNIECRKVYGMPRSYKSLPPLNESTSYLYGWLAGYFAADGNIHDEGSASITSHRKQDIMAVRNVCAILGINTGSMLHSVRNKLGRDYDQWSISLSSQELPGDFFLLSHHRDYHISLCEKPARSPRKWKVVSITDTGRTEEVFCVVQPETERFSLVDGILTMNCPRYWHYAFNGAEFEYDTDAPSMANMNAGSDAGVRLAKVLDKAGILVDSEIPVQHQDPPIGGFIDAIVNWKNEEVVVEIKTTRAETWEIRATQNTVPGYQLLQLLIYMYVTGKDKGFFLTENKNCVPTYSRIMTDSGWMNHEDLVEGKTKILTFNPDGNFLEWETYRDKVVKIPDTKMVSIGNKHQSFISTEDHTWIAKDYKGVMKEYQAKDLKTRSLIPRVASLYHEPEDSLDEKISEVIGWIASDGCITTDKDGRKYYQIYQEKLIGQEALESLLDESERTVIFRKGRKIGYRLKTKTALVEELRRVYSSKKISATLPYKMNHQSRLAYIRGLIGGDGSWAIAGRKESFGQLDNAVKESFQIAHYLNGVVTNINEGKVSCYPGMRTAFNAGLVIDSDYEGDVWCPTTNNGYWVMEQNGKPTITGNTHEIFILPIKMTDERKKFVDDTLEWMRAVKLNADEGKLPTRPFIKSSVQCKGCPVRNTCWEGLARSNSKNDPNPGTVNLPPLEIPK